MNGTGYERHKYNRRDECVVRVALRNDWANVKRLLSEGILPGDAAADAPNWSDFDSRLSAPKRGLCWVAEVSGVIVGTIALSEVISDIAHVRWIREAKPWQADHIVARSLLKTALEHARQIGFLKLIFHVPPQIELQVTSFLHGLGFEFAGHRLHGSRDALQFYLDIYQRRDREEAVPSYKQ